MKTKDRFILQSVPSPHSSNVTLNFKYNIIASFKWKQKLMPKSTEFAVSVTSAKQTSFLL